jgi:hypothetical protein
VQVLLVTYLKHFSSAFLSSPLQYNRYRYKITTHTHTMSEPTSKKQKKEEAPEAPETQEDYTPKNILLTGGAGEIQ